MKSAERTTPSRNTRRALVEQVREYVKRYYPQMGEASVDINPTGTIATVRPDNISDRDIANGNPRSSR